MKAIFLICMGLWFFSQPTNAQETWTCYTDKAELLMDNKITLGVFEYVDGATWFITNKGINIYKDGEWDILNKEDELLKNTIGSYLVDSKNRIWIGTGTPDVFYDGYATGPLYQGGVAIYDGEEWKLLNTKEMGIKAAVITEIYEASNGDFWLGVSSVTPGSEKGGLFAKGALLRLSKETGEWTDYRQKEMPCGDCHFVKDFYEDESGKLFFIADYGIYYFEDGVFHSVRKDHEEFSFSGGWLSAKFVDSNNHLWLGAPARIAKYDGQTWQSFNRKNGLPSMENHPYGFIETPEGKILMSTTNGLYTYDGNSEWLQEKFKVVYGNSYIDAENRLWIPTLKGLIIRDGESETLNKDIAKVVQFFDDKDGGTWALPRGKGVWRYKDGEWQYFDKNNQLPSNSIMLTHVSEDGTVWLGTKKGICKCEYE
ncbi:MAG: hypothetical protein WBN59_08560 [Flavobacteriaceae bacterium]